RRRVEGEDLAAALAADALVKPLAGLLSQPAAFVELQDELRQQQPVPPRVLRDQLVQIAAHIHHDVDADDIAEAEHAAAWTAGRRPGEDVHLFDRIAIARHDLEALAHREDADPVGDE